jgi:signal transduction histidine kinase
MMIASGRGQRWGTVTFRVVFGLYAAGVALWLILGLLPTLAELIPTFRNWLGDMAAGGGPLAAFADRILHADPDMTPVPAGRALLQYGFSVLNFGLGLLLAIRAGSGRNRIVPRSLAFALLGTASTFNEPSHRAFHITGSPWLIATVHFAFHIVSGVAYLWAVMLFPDGRLPRHLQLSPGIQRAVITAVTIAALLVGWRSSFIAHPQFFVVFFGICVSLIGVAATAIRLLDPTTTPVDRAASRLLWAALLPGLGVALFWCGAMVGSRLGNATAHAWAVSAQNAFPAAFAVVPVVLYAAVSRYRLWDIDRLLGRVLVYGALAAVISGSYVAAVTAGARLAGGSVWWVVIVLSVIAVAVDPARRLAYRLVNQLVYGQQINPAQAMAELLTGLQQLTPTGVLEQLAAVAVRATRARTVSLYALDAGRLTRVATAPDKVAGGPRDVTAAVSHDRARDWAAEDLAAALPDATVVIGVRYGPDLLGALAATGDRLTAADRQFFADIAAHAGLLLHNALLTDLLEQHVATLGRSAGRLSSARRRLVAAQDAERQRLERNLHDGAQQYLVAAIIGLRRVAYAESGSADRTREILRMARADLVALASGTSPTALTGGLAAALARSAELARRDGTTVTVTVLDERTHDLAHDLGHPPGGRVEVEEAAYFCCVEALQNAMKHAAARTITIRVDMTDSDVSIVVADDGRGFDIGREGLGGLDRLADRVGAIGGWVAVESAPGSGTTLIGHLPVTEATGRSGEPMDAGSPSRVGAPT